MYDPAPSSSASVPPLPPDLSVEPWRWDFFRAVRLLECAHPDRPRMGESIHPRDDAVRFGQNPSLAFAPSTLTGQQPAEGARPERLLVAFMGMFGPNGALPLHMTEHARDRLHNARDQTLVRFLDIFHHRMISLFYRAWADSQKAVDFDRPDRARFATYIASFFGLGMETLRNRDEAPDWTKIFFAGRFASHPRNPEGLAAILEGDLGVPARVLTFQGQWMRLPPESQCKLGASRESGTLGRTVIVGEKFWAGQLKFRLRFGPMRWRDYQRLLPNGSVWARMRAWVRNYIGQELWWEAQLVLRADEVPTIKLGGGSLLGWSAWLKSGPSKQDADQLVLQGEAA